ncbi:hypothetical protein BKE30_02900 [Alkanindiges hydrocarboniclasticus]|uniref:PD-(D/E)XK motif protein n=1 Tax=Alkanindiges hydrocarboniclasticus TaxID=1907941 RepID=A0A1S8CWU7_9GAMM|nr:MZA anti-phage system associated PD-(D/E)XK motif protein MzaD [Alkanindiges hydrocarboniclasticus]ONG41802.1 hypothetical protein BKE30_02900 [Alkanindiges hydrocarboniclasticus]
MTLSIDQSLDAAWSALPTKADASGWHSIPITRKADCTLLAARYLPDDEEALLFEFNSNISLAPSLVLPDAYGFKVIPVPEAARPRGVALSRKPGASKELFMLMATDIINMVAGTSYTDSSEIFGLVLNRIQAWQAFMKREQVRLTLEAELGLSGELECLFQLIISGLPALSAVQAWVGPLDGIQDFEIGHGAIEVKSTAATLGFIIKINSLDQLDDSLRTPVFLCGCRFSIKPEGTALPERIQKLRDHLSGSYGASVLFEHLLLQAGYLECHAPLYTRKFLLRELCYWRINENFPKLVPGNVAAGIRAARYEVDLNLPDLEESGIQEVLSMLGDDQNGAN